MLKAFEKCTTVDEKLQFLNSLNLSTIIKEKNDVFYAFIPSISISTEAPNITDCYTQLRNLKQEHFKRLIETDTAEDVLFSNPHFIAKGEWEQIKLKAIRYFMSGAFIIFIVLFIGWQVDAVFKRALHSSSEFIQNEVVKIKSEIGGENQAEKQKLRLEKFKTKLLEVKPYTDALSEILFSQNSKRNESKSK
jgi:hypothetical protein